MRNTNCLKSQGSESIRTRSDGSAAFHALTKSRRNQSWFGRYVLKATPVPTKPWSSAELSPGGIVTGVGDQDNTWLIIRRLASPPILLAIKKCTKRSSAA